MNKGTHLDLDTWIVPGQILKAVVIIKIIKKATHSEGSSSLSELYIIIIIIRMHRLNIGLNTPTNFLS